MAHILTRFDLSLPDDDPLKDRAFVMSLPSEQIPALLCRMSAIHGALAARLSTEVFSRCREPAAEGRGDELLTVDTAAAKLSVSKDWLYRRAAKLPFTVRLGPRRLRFSEVGIQKFIHQRQRNP